MGLLIKGGIIVDGTKRKPFKGNLLVREGKIIALGNVPDYGIKETVEANDLFIAPGFIDPDSSSDFLFSLINHRQQENYLKQGVTTVVLGHGGISLAPIFGWPENILDNWTGEGINLNWNTFLEMEKGLKNCQFGVNFCSLAGYSSIRDSIADFKEEKDLTENETKVFLKIIKESIEEGALGISFGFGYSYSPSIPPKEFQEAINEASKKEVIISLREQEWEEKKRRKIITSFLQEFRKRGKRGKIIISQAREEDISWLKRGKNIKDVYSIINPLGFKIVPAYSFFPEWFKINDLNRMRKKLEDSEIAKRIKKEFPDLKNFSEIKILKSHFNHFMEGINLENLRKKKRKTKKELFLELLEKSGLRTILLMKEKEVEKEILEEETVLISALINSKETGETFKSFLKNSLEKGVSVEKTINKITKLPAEVLGIKDRGELREEKYADLVLFDKKGEIKKVFIRGEKVFSDNKKIMKMNGKIIINQEEKQKKKKWDF